MDPMEWLLQISSFKKEKMGAFLVDVPPKNLHLGLSSSELVKGCLDLFEIMQLLRK